MSFRDEIKNLDTFHLAAIVDKQIIFYGIASWWRHFPGAEIKYRIKGKSALMNGKEIRNYLENLYERGRQTMRIPPNRKILTEWTKTHNIPYR